MWEFDEGTQVRFCKKILSVLHSASDGSLAYEIYRGSKRDTVLQLVRKVLFCDHTGSMGQTGDQLLGLTVGKCEIDGVGIKNKEEL